jgi:hypothetical protein
MAGTQPRPTIATQTGSAKIANLLHVSFEKNRAQRRLAEPAATMKSEPKGATAVKLIKLLAITLLASLIPSMGTQAADRGDEGDGTG